MNAEDKIKKLEAANATMLAALHKINNSRITEFANASHMALVCLDVAYWAIKEVER